METELGKLYISGMSWITTENKLNQYFSKYGLVKESVIFLNVDTNHSTGFGSIIFEDPFVLSSVLQQTHYIDNYPVDVIAVEPVLGISESSITVLDETCIEPEENMNILQLTREFKRMNAETSSEFQQLKKEVISRYDRLQLSHDNLRLSHDNLELEFHKLKRLTKYKEASGRDFSEQHHTSASSVGRESNIHKKKIFVGGLPTTLTDEKLIQYFENFGPVKYGRIRTDPLTNNSRKFAYVEFDTEDAVDKVLLEGPYHKLDNVTVEVKRAKDKDKLQRENIDLRPASHHENYNSYYSYPFPSHNNNGAPNYNAGGYNVNEFANSNVVFTQGYYNPSDPNMSYARGISNTMHNGYRPNTQWNVAQKGRGDAQSSGHAGFYG